MNTNIRSIVRHRRALCRPSRAGTRKVRRKRPREPEPACPDGLSESSCGAHAADTRLAAAPPLETMSPGLRMTPTTTDQLEAGRAALARGAWDSARLHFEAAGDSPEALDGLSWAIWWLGDEALTITARERAFRAFRAAGEHGAAARTAAWLAGDVRESRGDDAVAGGWLARARRELEGLPESADHGWVAAADADFTLNAAGDAIAAERLASSAARIGRERQVPDLEAV